jgi:peroxiredoxin
MIEIGDRLPRRISPHGSDGPEMVRFSDLMAGRRVVVIGVPGAFTPTCDGKHLPSFVRTKAGFDAKGVDEIICVSVNDAMSCGSGGRPAARRRRGSRFWPMPMRGSPRRWG